MPWCPVCKNEYKDGYTLCADCGAELVDFLKDENSDFSADDLSVDNQTFVMPEEQNETVMEVSDAVENLDPAEVLEMLKKKNVHEPVKPFVKASERAENYKSSAFALLLVGVAGAAFLILSYFQIIPINLAANINALFYIVMGIMFAAFIIIGVKTLSSAKEIAECADEEDELTKSIYDYFKLNCSADLIDNAAFSEGAESILAEEKFFPRSKCIRDMIVEKFGELDEAYLTELTENIYSDIFEK